MYKFPTNFNYISFFFNIFHNKIKHEKKIFFNIFNFFSTFQKEWKSPQQ